MRKVVVLLLVNGVIIALLLEIALRLFTPALPPTLAAAVRRVTTSQPYAEDWTPAWQHNRDYGYLLRPGLDDVLQYGSPTVQFRLSTVELWAGAGAGFRTDPVDYFVDAVVVGDSFGLCFTERADCWVDLLAAQTGRGLVNLSVPVTGTTSHYRILRDYGAPFEPPLVIWQFFGNDFNDDYGLAVYRDEIAPLPDDAAAPTGESGGLLAWLRGNSAAVAAIDTALRGPFATAPDSERLFVKPYQVTLGDGSLLQFGGLYEQAALDMSRPQNQIGYERSRAALQDAQTLVASWGGDIALVIIPTREEIYAPLTEPVLGVETLDRLRSARTAMLRLCDELSLRCYDAESALTAAAADGTALYHSDDMHLNAAGNRVLAAALSDWLWSGANDAP